MHKYSAFFFFICLSSSIVFAQPFQVGHKQQTFVDASRANRNITTEIYYPATTAGNNVPIASGQFPILVFGHGFVMVWSAYDSEWNAIVPSGYIMIFPTTETSFSPSHTDFGKDIAFLVGAMKAEGANVTSAFFGAVAATSAVMGHSMGGGSSFLAVQYDSTITALATLATANTNPSSITAAKNISIPAIVFSGANDCITPPPQHQMPMYDSLASSCKTFVSVTGGSHCQFANYNVNCYTGEGTCTPQPAITPALQQTTTFNLLLPWLDFFLKNDCAAGIQFQNLISAGAGIISQQNCTLLCIGIDEQNNSKAILIYPNPSNGTFVIASEAKQSHIEIYNVLGEKIYGTTVKGKETINLKVKSGIYFYKLKNESGASSKGKIVIE